MLMIRKYCKGDLFCLKTMPQAKKNKYKVNKVKYC